MFVYLKQSLQINDFTDNLKDIDLNNLDKTFIREPPGYPDDLVQEIIARKGDLEEQIIFIIEMRNQILEMGQIGQQKYSEQKLGLYLEQIFDYFKEEN